MRSNRYASAMAVFLSTVGVVAALGFQTNNPENYLRPGAGTVPRKVRDKLTDVVSVKDFGATPDDLTDDSDAFDKALLAADGAQVWVPPGTYNHGGTTVEGGIWIAESDDPLGWTEGQLGNLRVEKVGDTDAHTVQARFVNPGGVEGTAHDYENEVHVVLQAGTEDGLTHRRYLDFRNGAGGNDWLWGVNQVNNAIFYDGTDNLHRLTMNTSAQSGQTSLNSAGTGAVAINYDGTDAPGTGGLRVYTGGAAGATATLFEAISTAVNANKVFTVRGGDLQLNRDNDAAAARVRLFADAGQSRGFYVYTDSASQRWFFGVSGGAESGSNANSNFEILSYSDAGAFLATALRITRSTSLVTLAGNLTVSGSGSNTFTGTVVANGGVNLGSTLIRTGTGSPEGVVTAPVGSLYTRTDGGAGSTLYVKESGTGNTGWAAK